MLDRNERSIYQEGRHNSAELHLIREGVIDALKERKGKVRPGVLWSIGEGNQQLAERMSRYAEGDWVKNEAAEAGAAMAAAAGVALQGTSLLVIGRGTDLFSRSGEVWQAVIQNQASMLVIVLNEDSGSAKLANWSGKFRWFVPGDREEVKKIIQLERLKPGLVFVQLTDWPVPEITSRDTPYRSGKAEVRRPGDSVAILALGTATGVALMTAESWAEKDISCRVIQINSLKPFDEATVTQASQECGAMVTLGYGQEGEVLARSVGTAMLQGKAAPQESVILNQPLVRDEKDILDLAIRRVVKRKKGGQSAGSGQRLKKLGHYSQNKN